MPDDAIAGRESAMDPHPVRLLIADDLERNRWTVFFRALLAIPHYIWLLLWSLLTIVVAIANWLATLARGRSPQALHRLLAAYVKYVVALYAYLHIATQPYPPFDGQDGYPIDVSIAPPQRQSRWKVLFRIVLAIPALAIAQVLVGTNLGGAASRTNLSFGPGLLVTVGVFAWFATLARGRTPRGLRDAAAYALAYGAQAWSYLFMLTDRYPDSDPDTALPELPLREDPIAIAGEDDLRRSRLTVFFRLLLALPHLLWLTLWSVLALLAAVVSWFVTLARGRSPAPLHRFLSGYVRYAIAVYAFLYLVANPFPGFGGRPGAYPLDTSIAGAAVQSRWKTGFRVVLALPALALASVYGGLAYVAAFLGWFACLATARMPRGLRNAGALFLRYHAQTLGYLLLLTDSYPYTGPCRHAGPGKAPTWPASAPAAP